MEILKNNFSNPNYLLINDKNVVVDVIYLNDYKNVLIYIEQKEKLHYHNRTLNEGTYKVVKVVDSIKIKGD